MATPHHDEISRRAIVSGRVQGVWFRDWTVETARALGLRGWVRNRGDGAVELLATGPRDAIDRLIAQLHEGSANARVDAVAVETAQDDGATGFDRR